MSDALSATAEALARRALTVLPADQPRGRADIARLPAPIGRLLAARLDLAVEDAAPASPWIDHSDDRVREATAAWRQAAHAAVQFPAHEWASAVEDAASLALAHLTKPAETVALAAIPDGPVSIETAIERGRRFGPYSYLLEVATRYAERKGLEKVDRDTFFQLLSRIDRRMVQPFGAAEWASLFEPLFAVAGPVGSPPGTVPASVLRVALEAKGADDLARALGDGDFTADDFRHRLEDAPDDDLDAALFDTTAKTPTEPDVPAEPKASTTRIATAPPTLNAPPLPPVADASVPPIIGSAFEPPDLDESEVIGPARPVSSRARDLEDPFRPSSSLVDGPAPQETEQTAAETSEPTKPHSLDEILQARSGGAPTEAAPKDEPLWKRLARERGAPAEVPPPTPEPAPPPPDDDVPLWKRFAQSDLASKLPPPETEDFVAETIDPTDVTLDRDDSASPPAPAVEADLEDADLTNEVVLDDDTTRDLEVRVLGPDAPDRRAWYVEELFEGRAADYRETLAAIDAVDSYTEATTVVSQNVLVKHSVSPFSDAAIAFIDAVQFQFENR